MAASLTRRRFPPPLSVEVKPACFVVRDHNGQAVTLETQRSSPTAKHQHNPGRRSAAKLLSKDECAADRGEYLEVAAVRK
jgi:hypothetical protein